MDNLLAAQELGTPEKVFKRLIQAGGHIPEELEDEEIFSDRDSFQEAYGRMTRESEALLKAQTFAQDNSLDIRAMQLACKQLHILGARAVRAEEYDLPQEIDGEITSVHLKLVHDSENGGRASVEMHTTGYGVLSGELTIAQGRVSGYFAGQGRATAAVLSQAAAGLSQRLESAGWEAGDFKIVDGQSRTLSGESGGGVETRELYRVTGMVIGALRGALRSAAEQEAI